MNTSKKFNKVLIYLLIVILIVICILAGVIRKSSFKLIDTNFEGYNALKKAETENVLYSREVLLEDTVSSISSEWKANSDNISMNSYISDGDEKNMTKSICWKTTVKDPLNVQSKGLNSNDPVLKIKLEKTIDTTNYADIRLNVDFLINSISDNFINEYSFQAFVYDTDGEEYGPIHIEKNELIDFCKKNNVAYVYGRKFSVVTENLIGGDIKSKIEEKSTANSKNLIEKIVIQPFGNYPSAVDGNPTENAWRSSKNRTIDISKIKIVGKESNFNEESNETQKSQEEIDLIREKIVQRFYKIATVKWSPNMDFPRFIWGEQEDIKNGKVTYKAGEDYYGLPYTQANRVNLEKFQSFLENNYNYIIPNFKNIVDKIYVTPGLDCGTTVGYSIGTFLPLEGKFGPTRAIWDRNKTSLLKADNTQVLDDEKKVLLTEAEIEGTDTSSEDILIRRRNQLTKQMDINESGEKEFGNNFDKILSNADKKTKAKTEEVLRSRLKSNSTKIKLSFTRGVIESSAIIYDITTTPQNNDGTKKEFSLTIENQNIPIEKNNPLKIKILYHRYIQYTDESHTTLSSYFEPELDNNMVVKLYSPTGEQLPNVNCELINSKEIGRYYSGKVENKDIWYDIVMYENEYNVYLNSNNKYTIQKAEILPYGENILSSNKGFFRLNDFKLLSCIDKDKNQYEERISFGLNELLAYFSPYNQIDKDNNDCFKEEYVAYLNGTLNEEENKKIENQLIINAIANNVIYAGYAKLKVADVVSTYSLSGGEHIRMITGNTYVKEDEDGYIDPVKSYYIRSDINSIVTMTIDGFENNFGQLVNYQDDARIQNGYIVDSSGNVVKDGALKFNTNIESNEDENYSDFKFFKNKNLNYYINKKSSFAEECYLNYLPLRLNDFINNSVEEPYAKLIQGNTIDDIKEGIKGTISTNYDLISITFDINADGELFHKIVYPNNSYGIINDDGTVMVNSSLETQWTRSVYSLYYNLPSDTKAEIDELLKNAKTFEITINVQTAEKDIEVLNLKQVELKNKPNKTKYTLGEELDLTGGIISIKKSNGEEVDVPLSPEMVTGFDKNKSGIQVVKVSYEGYYSQFVVEVLTNFEKAFKEIAYSYYMRGTSLHYNVAKGTVKSPEESTPQDNNYLACAYYIMNVYKELLGIDLCHNDKAYCYYGRDYIGKRQEVIGYGHLEESGDLYWYDGTKNNSNELNKIENPTQDYIISQLRIGDIIDYAGHVMLVYDYVYDDNGNVVDVYLLNSTITGNYYTRTKSDCSSSLYYYDKSRNKKTYQKGYAPWSKLFYINHNMKGIFEESIENEGTVQLETLKYRADNINHSLLFDKSNPENQYADHYAILRFVTTDENGKDLLNFDGTYSYFNGEKSTNEEINYSNSVKSRLDYSKLYIEKTVDKKDNNVVLTNDELIYKIIVRNNSKENYTKDLIINEKLSEYVDYVSFECSKSGVNLQNNNEKLEWNIGKINSGEEVIITYKVTVKPGNAGKIIESTGTVANIPSGTVKNQIGTNIETKQDVLQAFESLKGTYSGRELINEIYKQAYGLDLNLEEFNMLASSKDSSDGLIYSNKKWGAWNNYNNDIYVGTSKNNKFANMVLNGYFNVLWKENVEKTSINDININSYALIGWQQEKNNPDNRANTIYPEDFKTGDILIYNNENDKSYYYSADDATNIKEWVVTRENGEYCYIYIEGKGFVGVNKGLDEESTSDDRNEFNSKYFDSPKITMYVKNAKATYDMTDELKEWMSYQSLFGKDNYVILRPSLAMVENIEIKAEDTELYVDDTLELNVTYTPETSTIGKNVTWTSSNPDVARVNENGVVRGIGEGKATITATTEKGKVAIYEINVKYNELRKAIMTTVDSYRDRGINIQYEQRLKTYGLSPEEATEDNTMYLQCTQFVWNAYYDALGISLPISCESLTKAIKEDGSEFAVVCFNNSEIQKYKNGEANFTMDIAPLMEPGDVISFGGGGHYQMVYSLIYDEYGNVIDAWIIHAASDGIPNHATENQANSLYDGKTEGGIRIVKMSSYYNQNRFDSTKTACYVGDYVLLRPTINGKTWKNPMTGKTSSYPVNLNYMGNQWENPIDENGVETYKIKEKAKDRMKYKGIYISKTNNYNNKTVVPTNTEVTYTVTIKNQSDSDYTGINIEEKIPEGTEYVSGGKHKNEVVIWENQTIPAGQTKDFSYTVKVQKTTPKGTEIIAKGKVNNIDTTTVRNIVGKIHTNEEVSKIENAYNTLKESENTGFEFVNDIYEKAFGVDLGLSNLSTKDIIDDNANIIGLTNMKTLLCNNSSTDTTWRNKYNISYYLNNQHNASIIKEQNLQPGQIILTSRSNTMNAYIYLGDKLVGKTEDGIQEYSHSEMKDKYRNTKVSEIDEFLENLFFAYTDDYQESNNTSDANYKYNARTIVINPANMVIPVESIKLSESTKELYVGDTIDLTAEITPIDATIGTIITWTSSDENIATVDENGIVTAQNEGTCKIVATTENGKTAECEITVVAKKLTEINITKEPTNKNYIEGQSFDSTGMKVTARYNDGSSKEVTDYTVVDGENLTTEKTAVTISYTENGITKTVTQEINVEGKEEPRIQIKENSNYIISGNYIKCISPETNYSEFKNQIICNTNFTIENKKDEDLVQTGDILKISDSTEEFILVVKGDTNKDGKADIKDIFAINKHRLNKGKLENEYYIAGDVNEDGNVDIKDIFQINKYRLGKVDSI